MSEFDVERIRLESGAATVLHFEELGSTNDWGVRLVKEPEAADTPLQYPLLILTDRQTAGRGQHHRSWLFGAGNLACTLCLPNLAKTQSTILPLAVGLAVCEAIEAVAPWARVQLKWPNDLVIDKYKLGGVLIEQVACPTSIGLGKIASEQHPKGMLVIGIGINVNQKIELDPLANESDSNQPRMQLVPISLQETGAAKVDLTELTIATIRRVLANLSSVVSDSRGVLDRCDRRMVFRNRQLELTLPNGELLRGDYTGLGDSGELLIRSPQQRVAVSSIASLRW